MKKKNILVTGSPGCGKSTLIERVARELKRPLAGFFTREIREGGTRVGFSIDTLDGTRGIMAHVHFKSPWRVGKYGVRMDVIDEIGVPALVVSSPDMLLVIDEIGKMECLSPLFRKAVLEALDSPAPVLGSIAQKGDAFVEKIKSRPDVSIVTVNPANRDRLVASLVDTLDALQRG